VTIPGAAAGPCPSNFRKSVQARPLQEGAMLLLIRASGLVAALLLAGPVSAWQAPTKSAHVAKHASKLKNAPAPDGSLQLGYQKYCGARFVCYTGIPLVCAGNTKPYQDIAKHECYCLRDNCPQ
jgi:hypothetical protein